MGDGNKVEFLVAMCALVTSMVAVFIGWDQGRVMRAQQHGAVFPVLQVDGFVTTQEESRALGLRISNNGVGPALIEAVRLRDGATGEDITDLGPFLEALPEGFDVSWSGLTGRAIAPGETVRPMTISWPLDAVGDGDVGAAATRAEAWQLEVCFCSVFDRCWQTREIGAARASRVDACPRAEEDIFAGLGESILANASKAAGEATDAGEDGPE